MKKKAFTLIELIAVLVILAILALIVTPLVMNIIRKARVSADKRSVDAYGRSVELAIANYLLDTGTFPTDLSSLTIEYTGKEVVCNVMQMKENGGIYLSECSVNGKEVKDSRTEDGWYHYGARDLTNEEYVDMYGLALKNASVVYYESNGNPVEDYTTLTIDYKGKPVECDVTVNYDGTIYMTKCKVNNVDVISDTEDGYYHYGEIKVALTVVQTLLSKVNPVTVTNYTDGNTGEMYTFSHPATTQTGALTDYRYIGANPNNYVTFNNELWRIIGVFTVEDENGNQEQRAKIILDDKLPNDMPWNSNNVSNWNDSTLNTYLNGEYYNSIINKYKNMISITKYYLGAGSDWNDKDGYKYYSLERGFGNGYEKMILSKIALMYPSDYIYTYGLNVDNNCFRDAYFGFRTGDATKSWLYNSNRNNSQWTLTPSSNRNINSSDPIYAYHIFPSGSVFTNSENSVTGLRGIRPTLYLNSQVKTTSGDGSEQNPYRLKL